MKDHILTVMRGTGRPLEAKEIARVLQCSTMSVASHLGAMAKEDLVRKMKVAVGEPRQMGPYAFPKRTATLWRTADADISGVRHAARVHETLPVATNPTPTKEPPAKGITGKVVLAWRVAGHRFQIEELPQPRIVGAGARTHRLWDNGEPAFGGQWHYDIEGALRRAEYVAAGSLSNKIKCLQEQIRHMERKQAG